MDKSKHFERELPQDYVLVKHVDAKSDKKLIAVYLLLGLLPVLIIVAILCAIAVICNSYNIFERWIEDRGMLVLIVVFVVSLLYLIPHELLHGITYKAFTGGKLTFGLTLTVAFCGVPELYVRKRASFVSLVMPFIVLGAVFLGLTVGLWFVSPLYGIAAGFMLATHIGSCVGDLHWTLLYLTKYRKCNTLMRDSGPEQWLYIPRSEAQQYGIPVIEESVPVVDEPATASEQEPVSEPATAPDGQATEDD